MTIAWGRMLREITDSASRGGRREPEDAELLGRFVEERDEAAFAALVGRHGPMVWGVCRRMLRSHQDAEDAFQVTFLVLVSRAACVAPREAVGGWLHGVAYHTALKARAMARRRLAREGTEMQADVPEAGFRDDDLRLDLQPVLDEELGRLPESYRLPVVLCDLGGRSYKEAARQLGVPDGTLSCRLARGRAMLAKRLASRGVALPGGLLGTVLAPMATAGVPPAVVSATVEAASLFAAGRAAAGGTVPAHVSALHTGVLRAMFVTKTKVATAVLLVAAAVGIGGGLLLGAGAAPAPVPKGAPPVDPPPHVADPQLLANASVREELRLNADQARALDKAVAGVQAKYAEAERQASAKNAAGDGRPLGELRDKIAREIVKALPAVLDAGQLRRFKQIQLQQMGPGALDDTDVAAALKLTDEQRKEIRETLEFARRFPGQLRREKERDKEDGQLSPGPWLVKQMVTRLEPGQRKGWEEMVGKPFELKTD